MQKIISFSNYYIEHQFLTPQKIVFEDFQNEYNVKYIAVCVEKLASLLNNSDNKVFIVFLDNSVNQLISFLTCDLLNVSMLFVSSKCSSFELSEIIKNFPDSFWITEKRLCTSLHQFETKNIYVEEIFKNIEISDVIKSVLFTKELACKNKDYHVIHMSSGTQGNKKFIYRSCTSLWQESNSISKMYELTDKNTIYTNLPVSYSFSFGSAMLHSIISNTKIIVENDFSIYSFVNHYKKDKINFVLSIPYFYKLFSESKQKQVFDSKIRFISSGCKLDKKIAKSFCKKTKITITEQFGTSETGALFSNFKGDKSLGKPFPDISYNLKNGTLCVLGREFHSVLKDETFIKINEYTLQDLFILKHNKLYFSKRNDKNFVNKNGQKVNLEDIQNLINSMDIVKTSKVVANYKNEIEAVIEVSDDATKAEIEKFLKEHIMGYKIPKKIKIKKAKK